MANEERVRPRTSNRLKRKALIELEREEPQPQEAQLEPQDHVLVVDDSTPFEHSSSDEEEQGEEDEEGERDDDGDIEGGVADEAEDGVPKEKKILSPPLLKGFQLHVAKWIYLGTERPVLTCHSHVAKLLSWEMDDEDGVLGKSIQGNFRFFRGIIRKSRLLTIRRASYKTPNKNLISAFVERWHPETNSFHLPFGEMTITLDDVFCLTGLLVVGDPVKSTREGKVGGKQDVMDLLGRTEEQAIAAVSGSSVKLTWLKETFMPLMNSDNEDEVMYAARAYVLYTFGTTLFADKTGSRVNTSWLQYTTDMVQFSKYAWGTATLAYLYRQLGMASKMKCRQIGGYATLLEAWIYEHFSSLILPPCNSGFSLSIPISVKYAPEAHSGSSIDRVRSFRERLDQLLPSEVTWTPYALYREFYPFQQVSYFHGCIVCGDIVEPYMPDRVLRQFGYVQTVPEKPLVARAKRGGETNKRTRDVWGSLAEYYSTWDSHVLTQDRLGSKSIRPWDCSNGYSDWFLHNCYPYVSNPAIKRLPPREPTAEPWEMINTAKEGLNRIVDKWKSQVLTLDEAIELVVQTITTLSGPERAGPSSREDPERARGTTKAWGKCREKRMQG